MYTEFVHTEFYGKPYEYIFVEAPASLAIEFLKSKFPDIRLSDFYVYHYPTLKDAISVELQQFNVTEYAFLRQPNVRVFTEYEIEGVLSPLCRPAALNKPTRKCDLVVTKVDDWYIHFYCDESYLDELRTFGKVLDECAPQYYLKVDPRYDRDQVIAYLKEVERNSKKG